MKIKIAAEISNETQTENILYTHTGTVNRSGLTLTPLSNNRHPQVLKMKYNQHNITGTMMEQTFAKVDEEPNIYMCILVT